MYHSANYTKMTDINATLKRAYRINVLDPESFGINLSMITGERIDRYKRSSKPCFFLRRELGQNVDTLRDTNQYRHCKLYKDGYLDYIARKEYATIEDWVADCGSTMNEVLYGFNKFDNRQTYVSLQRLLDNLDPVQLPETDDMRDLNEFMTKLSTDKLTLEDLLVNTGHSIKTYNQYMNQ